MRVSKFLSLTIIRNKRKIPNKQYPIFTNIPKILNFSLNHLHVFFVIGYGVYLVKTD